MPGRPAWDQQTEPIQVVFVQPAPPQFAAGTASVPDGRSPGGVPPARRPARHRPRRHPRAPLARLRSRLKIIVPILVITATASVAVVHQPIPGYDTAPVRRTRQATPGTSTAPRPALAGTPTATKPAPPAQPRLHRDR
jgi:hypothetical protein